jgi:uncharacterized sodium:solute symporter family permease YidK
VYVVVIMTPIARNATERVLAFARKLAPSVTVPMSVCTVQVLGFFVNTVPCTVTEMSQGNARIV